MLKNCNGRRDRTAYVSKEQFHENPSHLTSDYHFLEDVLLVSRRAKRMIDGSTQGNNKKKAKSSKFDVQNCDDNSHGDNIPASSNWFEERLKCQLGDCTRAQKLLLENAATRSNVKLLFMSRGMDRRRLNKSYYNIKKNVLYWRVEFLFHRFDSPCNLDKSKSKMIPGNDADSNCSRGAVAESLVIERVDDTSVLFDEIDKIVKERVKSKLSPLLKQFSGAKKTDLNLFMKIEPCSSSRVRFHRIDGSAALKDAISGCNLIEFPTFEVALNTNIRHFPTLIQDLSVVEEAAGYMDVDVDT